MKKYILKLFRIPLFLFYYSKKETEGGAENFGDLLALYLVKKISKRPIFLINPSKFLFRNFLSHYFVIGSILSRSNNKSIVWGSGIIRSDQQIKGGKFIAVRGPRTQKRVIESGFNCDAVYGDPAILTPLFYKKNITFPNNGVLGVIPHYVDYDIAVEEFGSKTDCVVIDLLTDNVEEVIQKIMQCNRVISSSLHGVIIAHAYNIPAIWVKFSEKLVGDDVKFYDYFESMSITYNKVFTINDCSSLNKLFTEHREISLPSSNMLKMRQKKLLEVCPF